MAELQQVTKDELIVNILALYYNTSVAEVLRVINDIAKEKEKAPVKEKSQTDNGVDLGTDP
jgi:hypothetical protein